MNTRSFLKRLKQASARVEAEISGIHSSADSHVGRGMAGEGYAGGYLQALRDVDAVLTHGHPNDPRRYWE